MPINRKHAATAAGDIVALQQHSSWRAQKEELAKLKGLEDAEDEFIESLLSTTRCGILMLVGKPFVKSLMD